MFFVRSFFLGDKNSDFFDDLGCLSTNKRCADRKCLAFFYRFPIIFHGFAFYVLLASLEKKISGKYSQAK